MTRMNPSMRIPASLVKETEIAIAKRLMTLVKKMKMMKMKKKLGRYALYPFLETALAVLHQFA